MREPYIHHRITTGPRQWRRVADALAGGGAARLAETGGTLYGIWRSQIGRPRDELTAITAWPGATPPGVEAVAEILQRGVPSIRCCASEAMIPTLRPDAPHPPRRQGNYAFRWFETPEANWDEFLDLCAAAWPGFEAAYDSQVIGLWRCAADGEGGGRRSLLLTRRPSLAMWERSKIPEGPAEVEVRRTLSRRYDLCDWTCVYTTTLLTAADHTDAVRWS